MRSMVASWEGFISVNVAQKLGSTKLEHLLDYQNIINIVKDAAWTIAVADSLTV